jgi:hypothetical protein
LCSDACRTALRRSKRAAGPGYVPAAALSAENQVLVQGEELSAEGKKRYAELCGKYDPARLHPAHAERPTFALLLDIKLGMVNPLFVAPEGASFSSSSRSVG